ncbi:aspartyl protease family protein [Glacieibacterium frigidum]|uniref:Peptidase A2 domain-containing protein n=1 Tax=Glacieibacterium frigidum TaxID=2593303 RepID=A0A552U801_9SPHN|nr:aspartyl protease family protein [Glacieibacterium frigidum]TRW14340.1 hypothetical protein FMM06_11555 [Glacieibacterium frigidum]
MISRRLLIASGAALPLAAHGAPPPARPPIVSRIVVETNRIWTPVTIGDKGPFAFILDTGASMSAINSALARRLNLRRVGRRQVSGIGGSVTLDVYVADTVVLGNGLRQSDSVFAGIDERSNAGLLTGALFTSGDSDLDFVTGEWRLWPSGRPDFAGMSAFGVIETRDGALTNKILVEATLDGRRLRLLVDTGAPGEVLLFPHVVRRTGLWSDTRPFAPQRLRGIGGAAARLGRTVRATRLSIAGFDFDRPLAALHDPSDTLDIDYDGLLGLSVIERLDLSTEVRKARLWARANGRPKPAEDYGYSGLWLERLPDAKARVAVVSPGAPAAEAGLKVGDVLTGVDDWRAYLRRFEGDPGSVVEVTVAGAVGPEPRRVILRAYL